MGRENVLRLNTRNGLSICILLQEGSYIYFGGVCDSYRSCLQPVLHLGFLINCSIISYLVKMLPYSYFWGEMSIFLYYNQEEHIWKVFMKGDMCSWKQILIIHFSGNSWTSVSEMNRVLLFLCVVSPLQIQTPGRERLDSLGFSAHQKKVVPQIIITTTKIIVIIICTLMLHTWIHT